MEELSKEEIVTKYKNLLVIAKKAKLAKDELFKENSKLRDQISQTKEQVEKSSENASLMGDMEDLRSENESLKERLHRLTVENAALLEERHTIDETLHEVGTKQKSHLGELELEITKLKNTEVENENLKVKLLKFSKENETLKQELETKANELKEFDQKYLSIKEKNAEQRKQFNNLKDKFREVYGKLKTLKICKQVLLETQYEYANSVSKWQSEIICASKLLVKSLNKTEQENTNLKIMVKTLRSSTPHSIDSIYSKVLDLQNLCEKLKSNENTNCKNCRLLDDGQTHTDTQGSLTFDELQRCYNEAIVNLEVKNKEYATQAKEIERLNECLQTRDSTILQQNKKHEELVDNMNRITSKLESFEKQLNDKDTLIATKDKQISDITSNVNVAITKVNDLKIQHETNNENKLRENCIKLESQNAELAKQLRESTIELEKMNVLRQENETMKSRLNSKKPSSVLTLEIDDMERSLKDVTAKLAATNDELAKATEMLTLKDNANAQLKKEMALLEAAKDSEYTHSIELKKHINQLQEQLREVQHSKKLTISRIEEMEEALKEEKQEKNALSLRLDGLESEHRNSLSRLQNENDKLTADLTTIRKAYQNGQEKLKTCEISLKNLTSEFDEYKLKAQAVLRKNQTREVRDENCEKEELLSLRRLELQLNTELAETSQKLKDCDERITMLLADKKSIELKNTELQNTIIDLRTQNKNLTQKVGILIKGQQEALQNHKAQIKDLEKTHERELRNLQNKYHHDIEMSKMRSNVPLTHSSPDTEGNPNVSYPEKTKFDSFLIEREDGEGSEDVAESLSTVALKRKISTDSRRSHHDCIPLDELLNAPFSDVCNVAAVNGSETTGRTVQYEDYDYDYLYRELETTKKKLLNQEYQVRHLTALLAENEQDLAKLTHMNDMLKEDLRRQERGVEREKHMTNSEYLKNVMLKFMTLGNTDERARLVPVLNTILKLSPSETELLNSVAKGQKVSQDGSTRGWSGFWK